MVLAIAVNQFQREIDGKSQFHRRTPFSFSLSPSCPSVFLSCSFVTPPLFLCLHFPMFTRHPFNRERVEIPSTEFYGRFQGGSKFHPESPMCSRLNVFLNNKRYSWQREREGMEEGGGGNIPRYLRITKVTMRNDKSSVASETSHR